MWVLKFGGTSVGSPDRIIQLTRIVKTLYLKNKKPVAIVVSAFGGGTDQLIKMGTQASVGNLNYLDVLNTFKDRHYDCFDTLINRPNKKAIELLNLTLQNLEDLLKGISMLKELSERSRDLLLSYGERCSAIIIDAYFQSHKINSSFLDARALIRTNSNHGNAKVDFAKTSRQIRSYFKKNSGITHIITGFIASDNSGITTTLGRGGSDYTASIFAYALSAKSIDIWTDVNGVLTSDPRKVLKAFPIEELSYEEAMEMSHYGAKVIYPPTIKPLMDKKIPLFIKNTFNPEFIGSKIHSATKIKSKSKSPIKGISALSKTCLLSIQGSGLQGVPGVAKRVFSTLSYHDINIIMITQASSERSITIGIAEEDAEISLKALQDAFSKEIENKVIDSIAVQKDLSLLAVVGDKMADQPGVAGKLFQSLGKNGINVEAIAQGSSERNITFSVKSSDESKALNVIHDAFFVSKSKSINLYMVGVGLIGSTLLKQIEENNIKLRKEHGLEFKVVGLSNSRTMVFNENGIDLENWKALLDSSRLKADPKAFVNKMVSLNLSNPFFIDNTASTIIPQFYQEILSNSISIATPNKVACASKYSDYIKLKNIAKKNMVHFLYETNVGAGLPVISTIRNLVDCGDKIRKIEAVISGSISFIFNEFKLNDSFHDIVVEAKEKGFTEPDPREDLNGSDVKRKITILAREAGFQIELKDVKMKAFLPSPLFKIDTVEAFFKTLKKYDGDFEQLITESTVKNEKLRFIATYENGKASLALQSIGSENPFYGLSKSENMIVIYSERYNESPLVIRGPGAGAEVTAAGVYSELISVSKR